MSADVTEIHRYQAYCPECRWQSEEFTFEMTADEAADEHDAEHHSEVTC
ncbi:hypothetical protein [Pimelobacter simplex]|nr:hypothetical protein [Pimelobacter simplex]